MKAGKRRAFAMLTIGLVAACAAFAAATAEPARGQATVAPPLTGEAFVASYDALVTVGTLDITADCNPPVGQPTISYTATGTAVAPYPGPWQETGTATFETPTATGATVVTFQADFTIDSPVGFVEGTKQLTAPPAGLTNLAFCHTAMVVDDQVDVHRLNLFATYTADVTTETGTCTTEGTAEVFVYEQDAPTLPTADLGNFEEQFDSGTPCIAVCPPNEDVDNDGLNDNHESSVFLTRLSNDDSDFDGIADGNDDANGNGEDDEDEDDDDGCPDEDGDGDGEDDEDEDDEDDD